MFKFACSFTNLPLQPGQTKESTKGLIFEFASNKLLIASYLKNFYSSPFNLDKIITKSHFDQCLLVVVEVDTDNF